MRSRWFPRRCAGVPLAGVDDELGVDAGAPQRAVQLDALRGGRALIELARQHERGRRPGGRSRATGERRPYSCHLGSTPPPLAVWETTAEMNPADELVYRQLTQSEMTEIATAAESRVSVAAAQPARNPP